MTRVDVALLPDHVTLQHIQSDTLIVVDVLRASTTIVSALEAGASSIVPMTTVEDAVEFSESHPDVLQCGERGGVPPEGFVLGNSPLEYTKEIVHERTLVLTTTNGTRALSLVSEASGILIGSITNRRAVCEKAGGKNVTIVCAGTCGEVSLDDCLAAGLMILWLTKNQGYESSETAMLVAEATDKQLDRHGSIEAALLSTLHGQRLMNLGMGSDIEYAARMDSSDVVPCYRSSSNTITAC